MSSSASAMYLVAVFQEVTLAVTIDRDGGVLLGLRRAAGLDPGGREGASPVVGEPWRPECLLKTLLWQSGGVGGGLNSRRSGGDWPLRNRGDRR